MSILSLDKQLEQIRTEIQKMESLVEQVRTENASRAEAMELAFAEKIQQPPDFSEIRTEFTRAQKTLELALLNEIQQLRISSELSQMPDKLEEMQKQTQDLSLSVSQISSTPEKLDLLQEQVKSLVLLIPQLSPVSTQLDQLQATVKDFPLFMSRLAPVLPSDKQGRVDPMIAQSIQVASNAIIALGQELTSWIQQRYVEAQATDQKLEEVSHALLQLKKGLRSSQTNGESSTDNPNPD